MKKYFSKNFIKFFLYILFPVISIDVSYAELSLDSAKISYDSMNEIIIADGDVVVIQDIEPGKKRELHCEKVEYNKKTGEIKLLGEAVVKEHTGEIIKAKDIQLDDKLKKAMIHALLLILKDNARLRAVKGEKVNHIYTFDKASYTPCNETSCSLPLWDLFADKVEYDSKKKTFTYRNVKLRLKGQTILYSPYFSHPSFEVKRQSGVLMPIISLNSDTGTLIGIPYFIVLDKDKDLKLTPFLDFQKRGFATGEYRQSLKYGDFNVNSSVLTKSHAKKTCPENKKTRWHVSSLFQSYDLDNKRFVLKVNRASDVTYMQTYPVNGSTDRMFLQRRSNESKVSMDAFDENYFITTNAYVFQTPNLIQNPVATPLGANIAPIVLPHVNINFERPETLNGTAVFNSDTVCLSRDNAIPPTFSIGLFRSSNKISWVKSMPVNRVLVDVDCGAKADVYSLSENESGFKKSNKVFSTLENQISGFYPLTSTISKNQTSIWGPKIAFSSTYSINSRKNFDVNEDCIFNSFDDMNLYSLNRYGMYDRVEEGEKISAGFENSIYNSKRRWLNFFIGKSQSLDNRGIDSQNKKYYISDRNAIVGRFLIKPLENTSIRTRFVGFPGVNKVKMFESGVNFKIRRFSASCGYLFDARLNEFRGEGMSQVGLTLGYKVTKYWRASCYQILNLKKKMGKRNLSQGVFLNYEDECFGIGFGVYKSKYKDENEGIKPNTGIAFSVYFKNLGNLGKPTDKFLYKSTVGQVS